MRHALLAAPLSLMACATEQERCISQVTKEVRTLERLIVETKRNVERGFAVDRVQQVRERTYLCTATTESGEEVTQTCAEAETYTTRVPRAIDLNAEQEKLDSMMDRVDRARAEANAEVRQCQATYPES